MTRKSKQAGGNFPLTHYERTKKFASSEYGTVSQRLAASSQYQVGECALSLSPLDSSSALVSPSGYLYEKDAIIEYLLTQTSLIREQRVAYDRQREELRLAEEGEKSKADGTRSAETLLREAQDVVKKQKTADVREQKQAELKRTSYWLADSQADAKDRVLEEPPDRPPSPHSQLPLRRKDLWTVRLKHEEGNEGASIGAKKKKLVCALSGKVLMGDVTAYWTQSDKKHEEGVLVLTKVYKDLCTSGVCPLTSKKIRDVRSLQKSGSSFAASGQSVQVKKYTPTIT
jgi:nitric oxide synthase-interacting protein